MMPNSIDAHDDRTILAGKYLLEELIGTGGMGTVYRAQHLVLGSPVAVKLMHRSQDPLLAERFLREARIAAAARHPNVVSILDFGTTEDDQPFMVMEFLEGRALSDYIESPGSLSLEAQLSIITQILSGLDAVHRAGIIHRDLKPANIFVTQLEDGTYFARLLDFGISFSVDPESALRRGRFGTDAQLIIGTPEYMSFEQAQGQADIDERADVYAMGVILYELLSGGHIPYADANPGGVLFKIFAGQHVSLAHLRPDVPALAAVIERALSNDREARPASAQQLRRELLAAASASLDAVDGPVAVLGAIRERRTSDRPTRASYEDVGRGVTGVSSGAPSLPYLRADRRRRSRWLAVGAGAALLTLAGIGATWLGGATPPPPAPHPPAGVVASPAVTAIPSTPVSVPSTPPDAGLVPATEAHGVASEAPIEAPGAEPEVAPTERPRRAAPERRRPTARDASPGESSEPGARRLRRGLIVRDLDF